MRERIRTFIRHLLRVTGLLLGAMVLSMACGEGVLRLCPVSVLPADLQQELRAAPRDVGRSHPTIGVLEHPFQTGVFTGPDMQPVYHTDGHGFRNPSPWPPEADIVVLGDSVAFGYGVEDTQVWPALLAQWLTPQRVLNLGLIDAGPQQYLRVYETFESALHPRVVLVGLSLATDFDDAELFDRWGRTPPGRIIGSEDLLPMRLAHPLDTFHTLVSRYSYLFRIVGSSGARVTPFRCLDGVWLPLFPDQFVAVRAKTHPDQHAPSGAAGATPSARAGAGAGGVYPRRVPAEQGSNLSPAATLHAPDLQHPLQAALAQRGIAMLDLTPVFRHRATLGARLFFPVDSAPNAQGQLLIARSVFRHLTGQAPTDQLRPWGQESWQGE